MIIKVFRRIINSAKNGSLAAFDAKPAKFFAANPKAF